MSQQGDTPRTDAEVYTADGYGLNVDAHFARRLERELTTATRERDEARAEVEMLRSALRAMLEIHGVRQAHVRPDSGISQSWVDVSEIARKALAATEAKR